MNARFFAVSFGCLLVAASSLDAKDPAARPEVEVCKPIAREVSDYQDFTGRLEAVKRVDIRPRVSGLIAKIAFKEGSAVKAGDLLFELDARLQQAEMDKAKTEIQVAEAHLNRAKAALERMKLLLKNSAIGTEEVDKALSDVEEAEASLKVSKASLEIAQIHLSFTRITASISGKIGRANIDAGNLVKADDSILATIFSTDPIYASFDIDERTLLRIRRLERDGKLKINELPVAVGLTDETGFPHEAKLDSVNSQIDPATGTARCRVILPNAKQEMMPGMFVRMRLTTGDPYKALLVPTSAFISRGGDLGVFVLNAKDEIEIRSVKTRGGHDGLLVRDGLLAVTEGFKEDDRIIVNGKSVDTRPTDGPLPDFPLHQYRVGMTVKPKLVDPTEAAPKEKSPWEKKPRNPKRKQP